MSSSDTNSKFLGYYEAAQGSSFPFGPFSRHAQCQAGQEQHQQPEHRLMMASTSGNCLFLLIINF